MASEETFGPVVPLFRFDAEKQATAMANDSQFGLPAYFYNNDIRGIWHVARARETGMIAIDDGIISTEVAPFGEVKESDLGREGSHYALHEFMELKYLCLGGFRWALAHHKENRNGTRQGAACRVWRTIQKNSLRIF